MQGDFDGIYTKLSDFESNIGKPELFYRKIGGRDLKQAEGKWAEVNKASYYISGRWQVLTFADHGANQDLSNFGEGWVQNDLE